MFQIWEHFLKIWLLSLILKNPVLVSIIFSYIIAEFSNKYTHPFLKYHMYVINTRRCITECKHNCINLIKYIHSGNLPFSPQKFVWISRKLSLAQILINIISQICNELFVHLNFFLSLWHFENCKAIFILLPKFAIVCKQTGTPEV